MMSSRKVPPHLLMSSRKAIRCDLLMSGRKVPLIL